MNPHLTSAVAAWLKPTTVTLQGVPRTIPDKAHWLTRDRIPTPAEELDLTTSLEALHIPAEEWGGVCALADNIRQSNAEQGLTEEADAQIDRAERFLDYTAKDFLKWPWQALHDAVGGMAPGTMHYIICPSKGGKTTLAKSATKAWCQSGHKVLYGGFEMKAETLRTMYAAEECGFDPGDITSGAWLEWPDYHYHRQRMVEAYAMQREAGHWFQNLRFTSYEHVGPKQVQEMMDTAKDWGADAVLIDHVDELEGDARQSDFQVSVASNKLLLKLTKRHDLKTIITSQTNNTGKAHDRWRDHKPLRDEIVRFGDIKKQVATTMIGFNRPLKPGLTREERDMVEHGERQISEFLMVGANRFNVMASRTYGSRIGTMGLLGWDRGRIVDAPEALLKEVESARHAIRTKRGD